MSLPAIHLRPGAPADALCLGVLAMQVFLDTYATEGIRPDLAREALSVYAPPAFAARLADEGQGFLLAESASALVGFAEIAWRSEAPAPAAQGCELVRLYVQRPFQRAGVGRGLLAGAEALAAAHGAEGLWLTAWAGNSRALAFYAAQGYRDIGTAWHTIEGQRYENRVLHRRLSPGP